MQKYILSVDGGGSTADYGVYDLDGNLVFTTRTGPTSFKTAGNDAALANILLFTEQLGDNGISPDDILVGVWGMSGYDTKEDGDCFRNMISWAGFPLDRQKIINDSELAMRAVSEPPGMVVVAGTGSVVCGIDSRGNRYRAGGWNYRLSDLGSGYWMGRQLLVEKLLYLDGCREFDPIFDFIPGGVDELSLLDRADEIAPYAKIVCDNPSSIVSKGIIEKASTYLSDYGQSVYETLRKQGEKEVPVILAGSIFNNELMRKSVSDKLAFLCRIPNESIVWIGEHSPMEGGFSYGKKFIKE